MRQQTAFTLPYTLDAEQAVLGGLMLNNQAWDELNGILTAENFYLSAHRHIFQAIQTMLNQQQAVDVLTLERKLKEQHLLDHLGGFAYLAELAKNTPSAANIVAYARIVKRDSQSRALFTLGNHLREEAIKVNAQEKLDRLLDETERQLTELTFNQQTENTVVSLNETLTAILEKTQQSCHQRSLITGVPFGLDRLDKHTSGAQQGDLIVLAARPSMGKTALSLNFLVSALDYVLELERTQNQKKTVQYFSLEMPAEQILTRLLSMRSKVSQQKIRQAVLMDDEDMARFGEAIGYIDQQWSDRLLIDDSSYLTPQMLRTRVRRNARLFGSPAMIIVDYLQLMTEKSHKESNRHLEISAISRSLKALAKEMHCPVIALSQLNRNLEQRADKHPMNSDLRESGSIEQDADVILFIYRDEIYHEESNMAGIAEIMISKQRNGPIGTVLTRFKGEFSLFENIPQEEYQKLSNKYE